MKKLLWLFVALILLLMIAWMFLPTMVQAQSNHKDGTTVDKGIYFRDSTLRSNHFFMFFRVPLKMKDSVYIVMPDSAAPRGMKFIEFDSTAPRTMTGHWVSGVATDTALYARHGRRADSSDYSDTSNYARNSNSNTFARRASIAEDTVFYATQLAFKLSIALGGTNHTSGYTDQYFLMYSSYYGDIRSSLYSANSFSLSGHNHSALYARKVTAGWDTVRYADLLTSKLSIALGGTNANGFTDQKYIFYDNEANALVSSSYGYSSFARRLSIANDTVKYANTLSERLGIALGGTNHTSGYTDQYFLMYSSYYGDIRSSLYSANSFSLSGHNHSGLYAEKYPSDDTVAYANGLSNRLSIALGGTNHTSGYTDQYFLMYSSYYGDIRSSLYSANSFSLSGHNHSGLYAEKYPSDDTVAYANGLSNRLSIAMGGTNSNGFTNGKFIQYDNEAGALVSSSYNYASFPLLSGSYANPSWITSLSADKLTLGTVPYAAYSAYGDLVNESKIGSSSSQVAAGNHTQTIALGGTNHTSGYTDQYFLMYSSYYGDIRSSLYSANSFAEASHPLISSHTVSGLTPGYFLKALTATTFGFAAHGLTYTDVGAAALVHRHSSFADSLKANVVTKSANYTMTSADFVVLNTATIATTITLPPATNKGQIVTIKRLGAGPFSMTISRQGADTIEGVATILLSAVYNSRTLVADGVSMWVIISSN